MTFNPREFLDLVTRLYLDRNYDDHVKEAKYRSCTSRAYYSAHLFTREKLKNLGLIDKTKIGGEMHEKVINVLKYVKEKDKIVWRKRKEKKQKKLWERLDELREKRGLADYDLDINFLTMERSVATYMTESEDIIEKVNTLTRSDFLI
jgi:hypothetical protein